MKAVEDNGRTGQTVANITAKSLPLYPIHFYLLTGDIKIDITHIPFRLNT
ncbi:hypothetical protein ACJJIP_11845 [Microbulbifer sp. VTAC004]